MTMSLHAIEDLLRGLLPVGDARFEYRLAQGERPVFEDDDGHIRMRAQLIVLEEDGTLRDVREQEVYILTAAQRADEERVSAYFRAWARALPAMIDRHFGGKVDTLLPHDFLFPEALDQAGPRDVDGFLALFASAEVLARWLRQRDDDEFVSTLEYFGLGAHADGLLALQRPAIRLIVDPDRYEEDDEDDDSESAAALPVGASRIGGLPDLPPGVEWPRLGDVALSFLAQLRLTDLEGLPGAEALPSSGLLSFFYDPLSTPSRHRSGTRVLHFEGDPSMFVRAAAPADRDLLVFPAYEVRSYEPERMMPPMESPFYEVLDADVVHDSAWYARFARVATMNDDVDPELPLHRLLGYTTELQGDPYLEAEVDSLGQTFDGWQRDGERERALQRGATRWRLLLQIDSAPRNTLLAQDGGFFYFLIPEEDLAARRFDQVWGISQGH